MAEPNPSPSAPAHRRAELDQLLRISTLSSRLLNAGFVDASDIHDVKGGKVVSAFRPPRPVADPVTACELGTDDLAPFVALTRAAEALSREQAPGPHGFVPSAAALVLEGLFQARASCAVPVRFCEWGSGYGVATSFAAMLGFTAYGIERQPALVAVARALADRFAPAARFVEGSYVPRGGEALTEPSPRPRWMATASDDAYERLGLALSDFDVVFAYPWPEERGVIDDLFVTYARPGALLITYCAWEGVTMCRLRPALYST
jgi:hypothetical protein